VSTRTRAELRTLVRFALVGVTNTALTLVTFALLVLLGTPAPAASALAFAAGAVNGYRLNRTWTFRATETGPLLLLRYSVVQALGAGLSALGMMLVSSAVTTDHLVAEGLVLPLVTLFTYTLSRRVFRAPGLARG